MRLRDASTQGSQPQGLATCTWFLWSADKLSPWALSAVLPRLSLPASAPGEGCGPGLLQQHSGLA